MPPSPRFLTIPIVTAVGAAQTACVPAIVGDWEIVRMYGKALPISYIRDGKTYTKSGLMSFERDGDAELTFSKTVNGVGPSKVSTGSWEASGASYEIRFRDVDALTCDLDGRNTLECEGESQLEAERI